MSDEKKLTVVQPLTPATWQMIKEVAPAMKASQYFGVASPEAAMAIMLKGYEVGLSLTASFEFVQVIQGRPTLSPRGALALIQQSPSFIGMRIEDIKDSNGNPQACRVSMKRKNGFEYTVEYTMEEAQQAGLVKKESGWDKYPSNMLRWRAIGFCADVVFPDVIGGMKRADEFGADLTQDGDVLWSEPNEAVVVKGEFTMAGVEQPLPEPEPEQPEETIPDYGLTLQDLMEKCPDTDVLEANGGQFPVTPEQCNIVAHKLVLAGKLAVNGEEDDSNPSS